jgi:hypothetical protein
VPNISLLPQRFVELVTIGIVLKVSRLSLLKPSSRVPGRYPMMLIISGRVIWVEGGESCVDGLSVPAFDVMHSIGALTSDSFRPILDFRP